MAPVLCVRSWNRFRRKHYGVQPAAKGVSMQFESLTIKNLGVRPVVLKLQRPVVACIATINHPFDPAAS